MISIGIEELCKDRPEHLRGKRLGLLANQASTDRHFRHSRDLIIESFPDQLTTLFSPQHGFFSEKQDNMVESDHTEDRQTGLPVYSLYGETRKPYPEMFADIDVLLVDLIDVGTRVYTFIWTVVYCLETAAETGVEVIILDRPNPIGGHLVEGNILKDDCRSFVGMCAIPMRHGLTLGELALLCRQELGITAKLSVIPVKGWRRNMFFADTGFPWVFPSPNMPSPITAMVYPGQVIWEGTTVSEARGTTLPFEMFGAPYVDHKLVTGTLSSEDVQGCLLRPLVFQPVAGKWAEVPCNGFQIHVTDEQLFKPYRTSLALLRSFLQLFPEEFTYKEPPYEYEYHRLPMDLILGDKSIRKALEAGVEIAELEKSWQSGLVEFARKRQGVFLYEG